MTSAFADPPITPKAAATRARLLEVAAAVFIEQGYAAVSLRDIAKAAEVTKGAIYGHFRSKGQLLVEVIRTQLAERDARFDMNAVAEQPMTALVQFINPDSRDLRLLQIDAAAAARHDPDVAAGVQEIFAGSQRLDPRFPEPPRPSRSAAIHHQCPFGGRRRARSPRPPRPRSRCLVQNRRQDIWNVGPAFARSLI